ncbi:Exopolygalacturonase C [Cladophialophora carrionii]|uniref:galacturonan 1,4-alpha-galacturonidase n=1 Tax=Cladophialophora carrionii TaxID=86049 RepID=A0A1C1CDC0_9EURO|nr:Exopolygalacturonase C [Cladophialophora carrionii]
MLRTVLACCFLQLASLATSLSVRQSGEQTTCTIPSQFRSSGGKADDSPAISSAFARCARDSTIVFSKGVDYNVLQPISATNLSNVTIRMQGTLHLPKNITAVQALVNKTTAATNASALYWFTLSGPSIDYVGTSNVSTGWINSYGQAWWDSNPKNGSGAPSRPHLMSLNTTNGSVRYFKSRKPIAWGMQVSGKNITISDTVIDAVSDSHGFPFNTDGFDVGGSDIRILNSVIFNGDDAIAVQAGADNVLFQGGTIGYQSHGMSIGSLGQNQAKWANLSNIRFDDITVINAVYAARFKSWIGGKGLAKNITWSNIRVYNVTFPIFVTQTYINQGSAQTQLENGTTVGRPNNSTVNMEDFTWANFTGTINTFNPGDGSCVSDPCWYDVGLPDLRHTEAVIIECNTNRSCKNFALDNIQVFPETLTPPTVICIDASAALNPNLGFQCANGTYTPI